MWVYNSPVGMVYIIPHLECERWVYGVYFKEMCHGGYSSPQAAADDVYTCGAFFDELRSIAHRPHDLSEWFYMEIRQC